MAPTPHPTTTPTRRRDRGAAVVEFALVVPVLLMLLVGMFTGGIAYDRNQSIVHGAREAARFGATLPSSGSWVAQVEAAAVANADGNLDPGTAGRILCVALVDGGSVVHSSTGGTCFADGLTGKRVQVVTGTSSDLDAIVWSRTLQLRHQASVAYEASL
jgi:hypothetical protein